MTQASTGIAEKVVPIQNLDNPTAQNTPMKPAQPAQEVIAQQVQTPPIAQVLPGAETAAPAGSSAPAQAISPDFPIEHNGQQLTMKDVLATHDLAAELRLGDPNMADFLRTVSLAYRGDASALKQLQTINEQLQPAVPAPVVAPAAVASAAVAPAAPVQTPAAGAIGQPASGGLPTSQPPTSETTPAQPASAVLPSGVAEHLTKGVIGVINNSIKPLMDDFHSRKGIEELTQIGDFLKGREKDFPNLSRNKDAADRIRSQWNDLVSSASKDKTARPDGTDLERIIRNEEAYVASSTPTPQNNGQPVEITRMDQPSPRIPGRQVPGRPAPGPLDAVQGITRPAAVATTVSGVPGAAPGVEPQTAAPMNQQSLGEDLQRQFREMGAPS